MATERAEGQAQIDPDASWSRQVLDGQLEPGLRELGDPALQENASNRLGGMDKVPDLILRFERERQSRAKADG